MTETNTELLGRLVVGRSVDGRSRYDAQAKLQLVQACLKPGVSVARMALRYGINANLLRKWISKAAGFNAMGTPASAFIAMQVERGARPVPCVSPGTTGAALPGTGPALKRLQVHLPNGVRLDIAEASLGELSSVVQMLSHLPCSN